MKSITPYLITKLYTWTVNDLNKIFDTCFIWNPEQDRYDGPSSIFSMILAALIDTWGSVLNDEFGGKSGNTDKNVKAVLRRISSMEGNKDNYRIFKDDNDTIDEQAVELFRHNLIHNFDKKPKGVEFDLNIDTRGLGMNQQENGRWHVNCKKMKEDLLNVLRLELPNMLSETHKKDKR